MPPPSKAFMEANPPTGLFLSLDPPCKQYLLYLHEVIWKQDRPSKEQKRQHNLYTKSRQIFLKAYLESHPLNWQRADLWLSNNYKDVGKGYDDLIFGEKDCNEIQDEEGGVFDCGCFVTQHSGSKHNLYDFVVDELKECDSGLIVCPGCEEGIKEVVKEWVESNVWKGQDEHEEKKKAKSVPVPKKKPKKAEWEWDSDADY
ncbi:hypothetical protein TrLO_g10566 [Triparma laevis f. longispina]|uniref:Uncharacterized protein n=1 Tax=Triparma laevis f. longispina TaxID=1714387 RepID=A0A9W7KZR8_9STRA|nr:hypothetical protein TrLO_g10566 [Triparma laevis f. longispina]